MRERIGAGLVLLACAALALDGQSPQVVKRKLGPNVNGPKREMSPVISPDGTTLYFGREGYAVDPAIVEKEQGPAPKAPVPVYKPIDPMMLEVLRKASKSEADYQKLKNDLENALKADVERAKKQAAEPQPPNPLTAKQHIWMSRRQPDGTWGKAEYQMPPLNQAFRPTAIYAALPDNNTLLIGGAFDNAGVIDSMFGGERPSGRNTIAALVRRTATGWSDPKYLEIDGFETVAPRNDFFLAPGGKVLIVSIENKESVGKRDLYVCFAKDNGGWTRPKNLGAPVNSAEHEGGQFVAPDGVTMYFASRRPGGQGDYDIWVTRRLDDSWLKWSAPENLGPQINTAEAETFLSVDATGKFAYLASGKLMEEDIYEFALPDTAKPKPVAFVRGRVKDPTGAPVPAGIVYERLRDGAGVGAASANPADGHYQIALPLGEDYGFLAGAAGYIAVSEHLDLRTAKVNDVVERDLTLVPIKTRQPIRLNNVFFKTNEAVLLPESQRELDRLAKLLRDNPTMAIEVAGHTDAQADAAFNMTLSQARAGAVTAYLVKAGIAAGRLQARGYGLTKPVATNSTEEGRALNRRVEFLILKQ